LKLAPLNGREYANGIIGFVGVASDVKKRWETGQLGIFDPIPLHGAYNDSDRKWLAAGAN
jgi:hypothetical protein